MQLTSTNSSSSAVCRFDNDRLHLGLVYFLLFLFSCWEIWLIIILFMFFYCIFNSQPKPPLVPLSFLKKGIHNLSEQAFMIDPLSGQVFMIDSLSGQVFMIYSLSGQAFMIHPFQVAKPSQIHLYQNRFQRWQPCTLSLLILSLQEVPIINPKILANTSQIKSAKLILEPNSHKKRKIFTRHRNEHRNTT